MSFYDSIAATASGLLSKFGKPFEFTRTTGGSINPVTGATVPGVVTKFYPNGIFKKINKDDLVDSTQIQQGDKMILIDSAAFTPTMTDTVTINGAQWNIVDVTPVEPAGQAVIFYVQTRR
jgi:hypothetical protein